MSYKICIIFFLSILFVIRIISGKYFEKSKKSFSGIMYNSNLKNKQGNTILLIFFSLLSFILYPCLLLVTLLIPSWLIYKLIYYLMLKNVYSIIPNALYSGVCDYEGIFMLSIIISFFLFRDLIYFLYLKGKLKTTFGLSKIDLAYKEIGISLIFFIILSSTFLITDHYIIFNENKITLNNFWSIKDKSYSFSDIIEYEKVYFTDSNKYYFVLKSSNPDISRI